MIDRISKHVSIIAACLLASCGGGGGGDTTPQEIRVGLYSGEAVSSPSGQRVSLLGVVLPSGEAAFMAPTDCYTYFGSLSRGNGGTPLTATAYSKDYCYGIPQSFRVGWTPNSSASNYTTVLNATGSISSTGSGSFTYTTGVGDNGTISMSARDSLWARGASLTRIAGTYTNNSSTAVINATGTMDISETSRDVFSGTPINLTYRVTLSVVDPAYNIYRATVSHPRAGTLSGFAYIDDFSATTPNDSILLFARGTGGSSSNFVHYWRK